ncbi:DUF4351 domain-containing protein [Halanaerobacter jeridensis]|uniref:DUF4351 domain-containing protein n=1 Tax=Halanaerobacter jeridensis TaxID=706427 RepID=A0A939BPF4_9FIRM|nr:DUF4351 domain-containing protein [Halanaerobacter jeridensis]MBM7556763.1 hypothetical protein [Halanaerobacter jeridensis]
MKSSFVYYLAFKNNYESRKEYLAKEIDQILEFYQANFKEGQKEATVEMITNILSDKFATIPEEYIEELQHQSLEQLEKILLAAFEMNSIKELEEYFI